MRFLQPMISSRIQPPIHRFKMKMTGNDHDRKWPGKHQFWMLVCGINILHLQNEYWEDSYRRWVDNMSFWSLRSRSLRSLSFCMKFRIRFLKTTCVCNCLIDSVKALLIAWNLKAFALTGRLVYVRNYPGRCPGLGASALSGRVGQNLRKFSIFFY